MDYPGEWLLDLALLDLTFAAWSERALARAETRAEAKPYLDALATITPTDKLDEGTATKLARLWTQYLHAARAAGYSDCTPGRFLLPGDLEGSPALTFAPAPPVRHPARLARARICAPLRRLWHQGRETLLPRPFLAHRPADRSGRRFGRDPCRSPAPWRICAKPWRRSWARSGRGGTPFSAPSWANVWTRSSLPRPRPTTCTTASMTGLTGIMDALVNEARRRADFAGARTEAIALAALRATVEETRTLDGVERDLVRGRLLDGGKQAALHPGDLPEDPSALIAPAQSGATQWLDGDFGIMRLRTRAAVAAPR